jgi:hypothetical protein
LLLGELGRAIDGFLVIIAAQWTVGRMRPDGRWT